MKRAKPKKSSKKQRIRNVVTADGDILPVFTRGALMPAGYGGAPERVRVRGQVYRVVVQRDLYDDSLGKQRLLGCVLFEYRTIVLAADQPRARLARTLAHEIAHIHVREAAKADRHLARLKDAQEEAVCDLIADALEEAGYPWR